MCRYLYRVFCTNPTLTRRNRVLQETHDMSENRIEWGSVINSQSLFRTFSPGLNTGICRYLRVLRDTLGPIRYR